AKVTFDERTARESERRKALGIFLRLDFALDVLKYEAQEYLGATELPKDSSGNDITDVDDVALSNLDEIKEAWQNLDYFPVELSRAFYDVQNDLYNFAQFKVDHEGEVYKREYGMRPYEDLEYMRGVLEDLEQHCDRALRLAREETTRLRRPVR